MKRLILVVSATIVIILLVCGIGVSAATSVDKQVSASADDADQFGDGTFTLTGGVLRCYSYTIPSSGWYRAVGVRFHDIIIPAGATITSAYIEVYYYDTSYDSVNTKIYAHDTADAPAFADVAGQRVLDRTTTASYASWVQADIASGGATWAGSSIDLSSVVQELVDSYDYSSGADMAFLFIPNTDNQTQGFFYSYDSSPSLCPKLHIEYEVVTSVDAPSDFTATDNGGKSIDLEWTKGAGSADTLIVVSRTHYPDAIDDGEVVYNDAGTDVTIDGLALEVSAYFFSAWGVNGTNYSSNYVTTNVGGGLMGVIGIPAVIFLVGLIALAIFHRSIIIYIAVFCAMFSIIFNPQVEVWLQITAAVLALWSVTGVWREAVS